MTTVAYAFPVHPRHHPHLHHAYRAARITLEQMPGLRTHRFTPPGGRHGKFRLEMDWATQGSFERFTQTWFGVWLVNGMGLPREAFSCAIQTAVDETVAAATCAA